MTVRLRPTTYLSVVGANPITTGQVNFCDATAIYCTDIHLLGTAELTSDGTAGLTLTPSIGSKSYKAVFSETEPLGASTQLGASTSLPSTLSVTGSYASATSISASGAARNYSPQATVSGLGTRSLTPTGSVSFTDSTDGNLGSATLGVAAVTFGMAQSFPGISSADYVATGDFNRDGKPDIVAADNAGNLIVGLGNGDGTFKILPSTPVLGNNTHIGGIAVGDFNADGIPDLAIIGSSNKVTVLLGKGDGTFFLSSTPATGQGPAGVAIGDWNFDGKLDLAITNFKGNSVTVLLGNGDGTFSASYSPPVSTGPTTIATGDFNGDGIPDLAVVALQSAATLVYPVNILLGNGDGTFTAVPSSGASAFDAQQMAVGDFNGDGKLDVLTSDGPVGQVSIFLGNGDGTFTANGSQSVSSVPGLMTVGDFNNDGKPDVAIANANSNSATGPVLLLGNGAGAFSVAGRSPD